MVFGSGRDSRTFFVRSVFCILLLLAAALGDVRSAQASSKGVYHASVVNGSILGSAFMIEAGVMVTNAHVVEGRRAGDHVTVIVPSGQRLSGRVEALSRSMDLAVLSVSRNALPVVPQTRRNMRRGAQVVAIGIVASSGNPRQRYVIRGTVASNMRAIAPFGRGVVANMPQVRRGFSGGPVFDGNGHLVGMVAALRPAHASGSGGREAFIMAASEIRAEVGRLMPR